ncbi:GNAT family N-acetyltransferase [Chloroflexota bacterium]
MIINSRIILREKSLADARSDYYWETDPELAQLDAAPVTTIPFSQYLLDYASELYNSLPTSQRFAIDTLDGKHIGNCSYYDISETKGQAELGIMIGNRDYWNKGYGTDTVSTLVNHIFCQTNLNRIYLKTLKSNTRAQKCFRKCGFTPYWHLVKDEFSFMLMEIYRNQWQEEQDKT